jgi:hypothetical protein
MHFQVDVVILTLTTYDTFYYNAEINGQKYMNQVKNTQKSKTESNGNVFSYENISDVYL